MARFQFSLSSLLLFIFWISLLVTVLGAARTWIGSPRVSEAFILRKIDDELPVGTPALEVQAWIVRNELTPLHRQGNEIKCWILDTGPQVFFALIPDDICVRFKFGPDDKLLRATAVTEPRF